MRPRPSDCRELLPTGGWYRVLVVYRILADLVAIVHAAIVLFVTVGSVLILIGIAKGWGWIRGLRFRVVHLLAIAIVCGEWLAGVQCLLTVLENRLRDMGGGSGYPYWVDWLIFYDLPSWFFTFAYLAFGLVIAAVFVMAPPRWPTRAQRGGGLPSRQTR